MIAFPQPTDSQKVMEFALHTRRIIQFAKGDYPAVKHTRQCLFQPTAANLYREIYPTLGKQIDGGILDAILERRAANLVRLSMLFALLECQRQSESTLNRTV